MSSSINTGSAAVTPRHSNAGFSHSQYGKAHYGDGHPSRIAVHLPIVLFSDSERSLGVDITSCGRYHGIDVKIKFLTRSQHQVTYPEWLSAWSLELIKILNRMDTQPPPSYPSRRSDLTGQDLGLDISVRTYDRAALAQHTLVWETSPKQGQWHYAPLEYRRECCPMYRMVWTAEKGEAMLQEIPRRRQPWEKL
jgi:hypothetical protein